jgi:hypothetical protein
MKSSLNAGGDVEDTIVFGLFAWTLIILIGRISTLRAYMHWYNNHDIGADRHYCMYNTCATSSSLVRHAQIGCIDSLRLYGL